MLDSFGKDILLSKGDVSVKDILNILKYGWKTVLFSGILGLIACGLYFLFIPHQFEATAIIEGAKVFDKNKVLVKYFQEPTEAISQIEVIGLDDQSSAACGFPLILNKSSAINENIKLIASKAPDKYIVINVTRPTIDKAKDCIDSLAIYVMKAQESQISYINDVIYKKIKPLEERITLFNSIAESKNITTLERLTALSNIGLLESEIKSIQINSIALENLSPARLVRPIILTRKPSQYKIASILFSGLIAGLFFGGLLLYFRIAFTRITQHIKLN